MADKTKRTDEELQNLMRELDHRCQGFLNMRRGERHFSWVARSSKNVAFAHYNISRPDGKKETVVAELKRWQHESHTYYDLRFADMPGVALNDPKSDYLAQLGRTVFRE